jgi:hypothetical protein
MMPKPVQRVTVPSCLCEVGQKVHPRPTSMAPAVHENDRSRDLHGCEWHEALNAHAMNPVLCLIHVRVGEGIQRESRGFPQELRRVGRLQLAT